MTATVAWLVGGLAIVVGLGAEHLGKGWDQQA